MKIIDSTIWVYIECDCGNRINLTKLLVENHCEKCGKIYSWKIKQEIEDKYYKKLAKKYRKKLSQEQIEYNIEMIASEDEDYILLFKEGLVTKLELIELLSGQRRFD